MIIDNNLTLIDFNKLIIPEGVSIIDKKILANCQKIKQIVIPSSVSIIHNSAFYKCSLLKKVYYNGTIEDWCNIKFNDFYSNPMSYAKHFYILNENNEYIELNNIIIPTTITRINKYTFCCFNIHSITLHKNITEFDDDAFTLCKSLKSIYYNGTFEDWCNIKFSNTFANPMNYTKNLYLLNQNTEYIKIDQINISKTLSKIPNYAFINFTCMREIVLDNNITKIPDEAFEGCNKLTSIIIPDSVEIIGKRSFDHCTNLKNVIIPPSVKRIEDFAFYGCKNITNIIIPKSVLSIGSSAFEMCTNLTSITFEDGIQLTDINQDTFSWCTKLKNIILPNAVIKIHNGAFSRCDKLKHIEIPNSIIEIGEYSFARCASLKEIIIPDSVKSINNGAFRDCVSLKEVKLSSSLQKLSEGVFFNCNKLEEIVIPASVQKIESFAFKDCISLKNILILSNEVEIHKKAIDLNICKELNNESISRMNQVDQNYQLRNSEIINYKFYDGVRSVTIEKEGKNVWLSLEKCGVLDILGVYKELDKLDLEKLHYAILNKLKITSRIFNNAFTKPVKDNFIISKFSNNFSSQYPNDMFLFDLSVQIFDHNGNIIDKYKKFEDQWQIKYCQSKYIGNGEDDESLFVFDCSECSFEFLSLLQIIDNCDFYLIDNKLYLIGLYLY